jgi:hypothetical protein
VSQPADRRPAADAAASIVGGDRHNGHVMPSDVVGTEAPRALRADAERNRRRLIAAASEMFSEHGIDVGVAEIAERAGVGRERCFATSRPSRT